jgi:hypothetical protein
VHLSLVASAFVIASPAQRQASSHWPSAAWARAKYDNNYGVPTAAPVERKAAMPELSISSVRDRRLQVDGTP